jgi:hypothetical protein
MEKFGALPSKAQKRQSSLYFLHALGLANTLAFGSQKSVGISQTGCGACAGSYQFKISQNIISIVDNTDPTIRGNPLVSILFVVTDIIEAAKKKLCPIFYSRLFAVRCCQHHYCG